MFKNKFAFEKNQKIGLFCGSGILVLFIFYLTILNWKIECQSTSQFVTIPKGSAASQVTEILYKESCIKNRFIFRLSLYMTMNNHNIRSGRYNFKNISNIRKLLSAITSENANQIQVTLVEGWTLSQFADELHKHLQIDKTVFHKKCHNEKFIKEIGINASLLEGFLFPDTYIFLTSYTEEDIIKILVDQFKNKYNNLLNDGKNYQYTMEEFVTLASIIQGEAIFNDEMPLISSVYRNRLSKNMLLQADPTIQYILPEKPRRLFNKDLEIDSPYNTYKYSGLPPGPINNPGYKALESAMNPDDTNYLYFVSDGEGRHVFTRTVEEHNIAKLNLKRKRKMKKQQ